MATERSGRTVDQGFERDYPLLQKIRRKIRSEQASHLPLLSHEGDHEVNEFQAAKASAFGKGVPDLSASDWDFQEI